MRNRARATTAALGLLATACSSPQVEPPRATVKTAPPTTQAPPTTSPPPPSTATVPPDTRTPDEIAIATVIRSELVTYFQQLFNGKFDPEAFTGQVTPSYLAQKSKSFEIARADLFRFVKGDVFKVGVTAVEIAPDKQTAIAFACTQNNNQVWDKKMTEDIGDDVLVQGSTKTFAASFDLRKEGAQWLLEDRYDGTEDIDECPALLESPFAS